MTAPVMAPDERALHEHLRGGRFQAGVAAGRWRLISVTWPAAVVAVSAAAAQQQPGRVRAPVRAQRLPARTRPPAACGTPPRTPRCPLSRRPKGERAAQLFRTDNWLGGGTAMYAPWDRMGLQAHAGWATDYPHDAWNPARDLSFILAKVHEVINAGDYLGT